MKRLLLTTTAALALFGGTYAAYAQAPKEQSGIARDLSGQVGPYYGPAQPDYGYTGFYYYRGANSVLPGTRQFGPCGLPDHGAPNSSLNLNNRCDNEEFQRRNNEGADGGGR